MSLRAYRLAPWLLPLALVRCNCDEVGGIQNLPGAIVGTLCDVRTGQGAAGVQAAVDREGGGSLVAESVTGGNFRLENVPPGSYEVIITQQFQGRVDERHVTNVEVTSEQETSITDSACIAARTRPGTGWVRGKVCNRHTGSWVTSAVVTITLPDGSLAQTSTDAEGNFLLESIPVGEHTLIIQSNTFQRSYAITVFDGRETLVDSPAACNPVDPSTGGVEGLLCAPNGTGALQSASVYIDVGSAPNVVRVSDTSDETGYFILNGIPPGTYQLHVEQGAYSRIYPVDIVATTVVRIGPNGCAPPDPTRTGRIEGLFCAPSGGPLVGASVLVDVTGGTLEDSTDQAGHFELAGVEPGERVVRIVHVSVNTQYTVTVTAGQTASLIPQQDCGGIGGPAGEIRGRICAPNGETWLANARVWVDVAGGMVVETQTDAQGRFVLSNVPEGIYTVHVQAGSFTTDIPNVQVRPNEITEIGDNADQCTPIDDNHKIAVVSGSYDDVELVLRRLGIDNIDSYVGEDGSYHGNLLLNYELMQTYDVIFFNCGLDDSFLLNPADASTALANLRHFVSSGKSVYASDWAYDLVEQAWPAFVDFYGNDAEVAVTGGEGAQVALNAEGSAAIVVDPALRNALGQQNVAINFNLDAWALMSGAAAESKVYIRGSATYCSEIDPVFGCVTTADVSNVPFTVGFHPAVDAGKVIYTSFHQEQQTTQDMDTILQLLVFEL